VAVNVRSGAHRRVAHTLRDGGKGHALFEQDARVAVPPMSSKT
jgi:hypothetical protein